MLLSFRQLKGKQRIFRKLTGVSLEEFAEVIALVTKRMDKAFPGIGRKRKVDCHEDRLILLLLYYRAYVTHEFIGYLIGLDETNVCRLFGRLEPILAKHVHIKKDRTLSEETVLSLLVDVTEQPIQRPKSKKERKQYYSGKKKRHTQKVELAITQKGKIINVSKSTPGRVHDLQIRRRGDKLPPGANKYGDLGYQGWQKEAGRVHLPHKKPKGGSLSPQQKLENKTHSKIRITVEHKIAQLKKFRILSETYRNFRKKHHLRFNIISGLVNLQAGF